jgi:hypothetical protein
MGQSQSQPRVRVDNPQTPYQYSPSDTFATDELLDRIYDQIKPQLEESARHLETTLREHNQAFYYERNILRVSYTENGIQKHTVLNRRLHVKVLMQLVKIQFVIISHPYDGGKETVFLRVIHNCELRQSRRNST